MIVSDAVIVIVGATVVGATVVGEAATVGVGVTETDADAEAEAEAEADAVVFVAVGEAVVFVAVGEAVVLVAVGEALVLVAVGEALVLVAVGVVAFADELDDGLTTGPVVGPVVGGSSSALRIGGSPTTLGPERFAAWPIARGFVFGLACAAAGDSIGSDVGAGQLAELHATKPLAALLDSDAPPVPYQQMMTMTPSTPVPMTRFRTECGCCKSSSCGLCRCNDFPPLVICSLIMFRGVGFSY